MLSRANFLSRHQARSLVAFAARASSSSTATTCVAKSEEKKGELWQRPVRGEPGKVRLGFVPEEWFQFFYKKTGVTGPYTLAVTLSTYLISKEIYVMEHEYYSGLSVLIMWVIAIKKLGPPLAKALDKGIDEYEAKWNESRVLQKKTLEESISSEETAQWGMEGQNMLIAAKRENVALQLEASYRDRLLNAYSEVKKRLDYQVEKQDIERRIAQKNLVDWVVRNVQAAITPDQEKQNIDKCIADLAGLARA